MLRRILPWVTALLAVPLAVVPGIALGTGVDPADVLRAVAGTPSVAAVGAVGDGAVALDRGILGAPGSATSAEARALAQIRLAAMLSHVGGFTPAQRWVMPLETYTLSEGFGVAGPHWASGYHTGQDLAAAYGETVHAAHRGTVLYAGWAGRYGNLVTIGHEDGTQTWYAHLSQVLVRPGPVRTGQPIGEVGCTGNCFGTHLHFEVRLGPTLAVNPLLWLKLRGVDVPLSAAQIAAQPRTLPEAAQLAASPTGTSRPPRPQQHDPSGTAGPPGTDVGGGSGGGSTPPPSHPPTPRPSPSRTPSPEPSPSTPDPSPSTTPPPTDPGVTNPPPTG